MVFRTHTPGDMCDPNVNHSGHCSPSCARFFYNMIATQATDKLAAAHAQRVSGNCVQTSPVGEKYDGKSGKSPTRELRDQPHTTRDYDVGRVQEVEFNPPPFFGFRRGASTK